MPGCSRLPLTRDRLDRDLLDFAGIAYSHMLKVMIVLSEI